jgi:hypothetical protein
MGKIEQLTNHLKLKNHFSIYLSIFRIFVVFLIFNKIYHLWRSQSILLSNHGFFEHSKSIYTMMGLETSFFLNHSKSFLLVIVFTLILVLFGIGRKITVLFLFLELAILQTFVNPVLNGGDNLLYFVLFYMIFTNSYDHFVLNEKDKTNNVFSNLVSNLAVYSILIHLCYIYLISGLHKIHSDVWFNGTANYYILHLERFQSPLCDYIMNNGVIITASTYLTVFFELFFCVLIWLKSFRNILILLGILLHLGIFFFMMLYDFQIFFITIYGFFITNEEWSKLMNKLNNLKQHKYHA